MKTAPLITRRQFVGGLLAATSLMLQMRGLNAATSPSESIPTLSPEQIGHLRHFSKLANQLPGDWSGMGDGAMGWLGVPERTNRYQLANMAYATASVQYELTPAYREFYRDTLLALFKRLLEPDSWKEWASVSRGGRFADPDQLGMDAGEFDPIKRYNIMYGGHVLHHASLFESLYDEGRFTTPGSIRLEWQERNWGPGPQVFEYDIGKIVEVFVKQLEELNYEGFPCEPNLTFPECPQHAVLGMMLADPILGTDYSVKTRNSYFENFKKMGFVDSRTQSFTYAYRRNQKQMITGEPMAWADGWTGAFMHAWAPEFIEALYPIQRDWHVPAFFDRNLRGMPAIAPEATAGMGYFAVYAAEMGDQQTVDSIIDFADRNLSPVWQDGRYYYPRNDDASINVNGVAVINSALQGNALLPFARLLRGNGLWRMHNQPWTDEQRKQPEVTQVDYHSAAVSKAFYQESEQTLHIGFQPGPVPAAKMIFKVVRLDPQQNYRTERDGAPAFNLPPGGSAGGMSRNQGGELEIEFDPRVPAEFKVTVGPASRV